MIRIEKVENEIFDLVFENVKDYNDYLNDYVIPVFGKENVDRVTEETIKALNFISEFELDWEIGGFGSPSDFENVKKVEKYLKKVMKFAKKKYPNEVTNIDWDLVDYVKILAYLSDTPEAKKVLGSKPFDDKEIKEHTGLGYNDI